jgi:hypothetical protein
MPRKATEPKTQLDVTTHKLDIAVRALETICENDGPGLDLSPAGPCYHVAKKALMQIRHN